MNTQPLLGSLEHLVPMRQVRVSTGTLFWGRDALQKRKLCAMMGSMLGITVREEKKLMGGEMHGQRTILDYLKEAPYLEGCCMCLN